MVHNTELPDLRVLPTEKLIPHEDCDPRRVERLSQRIQQDGRLKNPPIVAAIPGNENYVVLDGANRVMAFHALGIPHIVAQLVSYEGMGVVVDTWYHVVAGMPLDEFESALTQVAGMHLEQSSLEHARRALQKGEAIAYIVLKDSVRIVSNPAGGQSRTLRILGDLVNTYKGRADIFRASNDVWEKQEPYYPGITALVIFPTYTADDILSCAQNGYKVPSGITRHIIPYRALNINIPLEVLESDRTLEQKRVWLHEWLMQRMAANAIRYYAESTFSFNE